jgi:hypothetical protein
MYKICLFSLLLPLLFLNGCGDANNDTVLTSHAVGQPWLDSSSVNFHGSAYQSNPENCKSCHGSNYQGGSANVSCNDCHFGPDGSKVPVGETWTHGNTHTSLGQYDVTCNACHTLMRSYISAPSSCHDCHAGAVSHDIGEPWLNPANSGFHGDEAVLPGADCTSCHGSAYLGGSSGVSCDDCHFGPEGSKVPVGESWIHGNTHTTLGQYDVTCNACHTLMRNYISAPSSCHDCHAGAVSHDIGEPWLNPANSGFHGDAAVLPGADCTQCHGLDSLGGTSGVSCSECHFGPDGSKIPVGVTWNHGFSHDNLGQYEVTCNSCHDLMRNYGSGPSSCHDCHL